ncbi:MAG: glycosyltransferase family 2 protein [Mariniphaga sp.]
MSNSVLINNVAEKIKKNKSEDLLFPHGYKISIALATFNGQNYIEEQLYSILNQTIIPFEIIICDDNSTDETLTIIENIAKSNPMIKVFVNQDTLGVNLNFQKAITLCKGDYIALSDQDDIWKPEKLITQLESILKFKDNSEKGLLSVHDLSTISSRGELQLQSIYRNRINNIMPRHTLLFANNYWGCTMMFNSALKKLILPFPKEIHTHDHWIALNAFCCGQIITIEEQLIYYRRHDANFSPLNINHKSNLLIRIPQYFTTIFKKDYYQKEIIQLKALNDRNKVSINLKLKKYIQSVVNLSSKINLMRKIRFTILYRLKI